MIRYRHLGKTSRQYLDSLDLCQILTRVLALGYLVRQRRCSKSLTQDGACFQLSPDCFSFPCSIDNRPLNSKRFSIPDGKILVLNPTINNRWVGRVIAIGGLAHSPALNSMKSWLPIPSDLLL